MITYGPFTRCSRSQVQWWTKQCFCSCGASFAVAETNNKYMFTLDAVSAMGKKWCKQINGNSSFMGISYKMKGMQNMNGVMRRKAWKSSWGRGAFQAEWTAGPRTETWACLGSLVRLKGPYYVGAVSISRNFRYYSEMRSRWDVLGQTVPSSVGF